MDNKLMFDNANVLVVGDIMLDVYMYGVASRISPEAPVPVVQIYEEDIAAGGAANVAVNLRKLGCQVELVGYIGDDQDGDELKGELSKHDIGHDASVISIGSTISKTRILADGQHMIRYDDDSTIDTERHRSYHEEAFIQRLINLSRKQSFDAVVISDYAKGTITDRIMKTVKRVFVGPIICDIKPINSELFHNVFCITPNLAEARQLANMDSNCTPEDVAYVIKKKLNVRNVIITMSGDGILLLDEKNRRHRFKSHIAIDPNDPIGRLDVTGAGDTVLSTIAACVAAKKDIIEAVKLSNLAAGIVVRKTGTATCSIGELQNAYLQL